MVELKYRLCSVCCSVMKKHPLFEKAAAYVAGIVNEEHARDPARAVRSKTGTTHTHTHTHTQCTCTLSVVYPSLSSSGDPVWLTGQKSSC